jgi:hypothetical protein
MALEVLKNPSGSVDAGMFNLPPDFDTTRYAAEWVLEQNVEFKKQRQVLPGTGMTADGWEVWKPEGRKNPYTVSGSGNKKFVLMCRPAEIQRQVNAVLGNVSKKLINRELRGETIAADAPADPGMLTDQRLSAVAGHSQASDSEFQLNRVQTVSAATPT